MSIQLEMTKIKIHKVQPSKHIVCTVNTKLVIAWEGGEKSSEDGHFQIVYLGDCFNTPYNCVHLQWKINNNNNNNQINF
jgi:hypothetical protein